MSLRLSFFSPHVHDMMYTHPNKSQNKSCLQEKGEKKRKKKGKCQKKSFRRRHLFSAAAMVPSVILYSETVMLFILVHYL
jgi:preprotein translocase subunit Sec63